jgi:hypothetical protein
MMDIINIGITMELKANSLTERVYPPQFPAEDIPQQLAANALMEMELPGATVIANGNPPILNASTRIHLKLHL